MQHLFFRAKKAGFTLVEMLIVIVIIGLLAAALLPKLSGMQAKARDTVRKTDVAQVATALQAYNMDNGNYPLVGQTVAALGTGDLSTQLTKVPKDPKSDRVFSGIVNISGKGTYYYSPIKKNGMEAAGFVVMAGTEEAGGSSNWVYDTATTATGMTAGQISSGTAAEDLRNIACESVKVGPTTQLGSGGTCGFKKGESSDVLRYILYQ